LDEETASILLSMASTSRSDQQREAWRLLCDITTGSDHETLITTLGGAPKISSLALDALNSRDIETERYVSTFLANMSCGGPGQFNPESPLSKAQMAIQGQVVEKLFVAFCGLFTGMVSLDSLETKKEALRCLDSLHAPLAKEVKRRYTKICRDVLVSFPSDKELSSAVKAAFLRFLEVQ